MKQSHSIHEGQSSSVVQCFPDDLQPEKFEAIFQGGAKAVILQNDDRVRQIWEGLLGITNHHESSSYNEGVHPWNNNILDIAGNHRSRVTSMGDVFLFMPGYLAQICRKIVIFPTSHGRMKTIPEDFSVGSQRVLFPQDALKVLWELMSDVLRSTLPVNIPQRPYALKIELIKYPNSTEDVEKVASLLLDGFGNFAHLGYRLERARCDAVGVFDIKGVRLLYALSTLIPGIKILSAKLNAMMKRFSKKNAPEGTQMIVNPHIDYDRVLTALISDRAVVGTEVFDGKNWVDLPLTPTSLAIFPSRDVGQHAGISPSLHRVYIKDQANCPVEQKPNITISIGVIEHPECT
jgi:hypothetical protein